MILADTSIWVEHLRRGVRDLVAALDAGTVVIHPFVLGELACGHLRERTRVLGLLDQLPEAPVATHAEALAFIEAHALAGRGVGFVDVHLLASVALAPGMRLWTRDRRLASVAAKLELDH